LGSSGHESVAPPGRFGAPWSFSTAPAVSAPGANHDPATATFAIGTWRTLRSSSAFDLFDRLEQQLSQQLQTAERVPAAEVHESPKAYSVVLELQGADKAAIDVKATEHTLLITAERRSQRAEGDGAADSSEAPAQCEKAREPLLSEFRYGTWASAARSTGFVVNV